jgi:N-acetylneuraminic acid mutarotase
MKSKLRWIPLVLIVGSLLAGCHPRIDIVIMTPTPLSAARVTPARGKILPSTDMPVPMPALPATATAAPTRVPATAIPTPTLAPASNPTPTAMPIPTSSATPISLPISKSGVVVTTPTPVPPANPAPSESSFEVAPGVALRVPRFWHTATRLTDGRILLVGGSWATTDYLADVDIFDPVTGQTSRVAPLHTPRHFHTATPLLDGRVLVIGGGTIGQVSAYDAEVYNPVADTWTVVSPQRLHGDLLTATLMKDGRVLVVGGLGAGEHVDIFDPTTNTWSEAQPLPHGRLYHTAQLLEDGRVLVAGGLGPNNAPPAGGDAQLYDPRTDIWTSTGPMMTPRRILGESVRLSDGRVLVVGGALAGDSAPPILASAEIYDPASNAWTAAASLAQARYHYELVLLPSGQVLAVGGARDWDSRWTGTSFVREIELYDPVLDQWRTVGEIPSPSVGNTATLLPDGRVWVTGGRNDTTYFSDTWLIGASTD